ncbi:MAG: hypothetical protein ACFFFB_15265 [Candidatus Heimdallarchaeota archaeon]
MEILDKLYKSSRANLIAFAEFVAKTSQKIGTNEASKLLRETFEASGKYQGLKLKSQSEASYIDAEEAYSLIKIIPENIGIAWEILEDSPDRIIIKVNRSPFYDACKVAGINPEQFYIDSAIVFMDTIVQHLNPEFQYELLTFKFSDAGFCEEQITLKSS